MPCGEDGHYKNIKWEGRGGAGEQLEREGWSWCTVREGGVELVYSWRGLGGAGVQLEREG